jgi:hypothetical protein
MNYDVAASAGAVTSVASLYPGIFLAEAIVAET